jgi:hypothetical protein
MYYDDKYFDADLQGIENVNAYVPGGFHPIIIGDVLGNGRYKILHKLGSGGFSTVWLTCNTSQKAQATSSQASFSGDCSLP